MLPETTVCESGDISTHVIYSLWPLKVMLQAFILGSQTFTLVSRDPDIRKRGLLVIAEQFERCPESLPATVENVKDRHTFLLSGVPHDYGPAHGACEDCLTISGK
jgi:hypothetical protein